MAACLRCGKEVEGLRGGFLCPTCAADQPRVSVTLVLIAINVLVFIVMAAGGVSILEPTAEQLIRWGAGCGVGWAIPRDGVAGLAGATGGGRAGAEYEREPRLPPPPARAQTAPASIKSHETSASTIRVSGTRDLMASPPHSF